MRLKPGLLVKVIEGKGFKPLDYRFLLLSAHYRFQLSFSLESLEQAKTGRANLMERLKDLAGVKPAPLAQVHALPLWQRFMEAVRDDLNAPRALACAWEAAKDRQLSPALRAGLLAQMAATVDAASGGRVVLGLGAGGAGRF